MRNRLLTIWTVLAVTMAAVIAGLMSGVTATADNPQPDPSAATESPPADTESPPVDTESPPVDTAAGPATPGQVSFSVDDELVPSRAEIEPADNSITPRRVGRLRATDGSESDLVLDELLVAAPSRADLQPLIDRWDAEVVDVGEYDEESDLTDFLLRVDPSIADRSTLAADLVALEPFHRGEMRASSDDVFALMSIAAHEALTNGVEVSLNWLITESSVQDGDMAESATPGGTNAMNWSWISSNKPQRSGIDAAWQLLYGRAVVTNRVKVMIVDRGFFYNADFPLKSKMRKGEWSRKNPSLCSGTTACPFHATSVTMAAMARLDNGFGVAGPAGPIADLIAMEGRSDTYYRFRDTLKVAKEERPHIINMSWGTTVTTLVDGHKRRANRMFDKIRDKYGALSFAAAGNAGQDVDTNNGFDSPCELSAVVCVGGVQSSPLIRSSGSNFGSVADGGSVEIYGPMCVYGLTQPDVPGDTQTQTVCGTSVASPVVAGVAALIKAANPTLGPKGIWQILRDTAHTDSLGPEVTGNNRLVDAYRAVATALNMPYEYPVVTVESPADGTQIGASDFIDLVAEAQSFALLDLPIQWRRGDGTIVNKIPTTDSVTVGELGAGPHVFLATATDLFGNTGSQSVEIVVKNEPPTASISSPAPNTYRYDVEEVLLDGSSTDPDHFYQQLDDGLVGWELRDSHGDVRFSATGHRAVVAPGSLAPGNYDVVFKAVDDGGAVASDTSRLTILEVPEGETIPTVVIAAPGTNEQYVVGTGKSATVRLVASATDAQDGPLPGTGLRWIAEQGDTRIVLCEGGDVGGSDPTTDCGDVEVALPPPPGAPFNSRWTITAEAEDSAGLVGRSSRAVTVTPMEG